MNTAVERLNSTCHSGGSLDWKTPQIYRVEVSTAIIRVLGFRVEGLELGDLGAYMLKEPSVSCTVVCWFGEVSGAAFPPKL